MAKKTEIKNKITIPDNVELTLEHNSLTVKGEKGEISRIFSHPKIKIDLKAKDKTIELYCKAPRRKDEAIVGTFAAHIKNMIKGVTEGFEYKMKTVFSHFPIKTSVEGNEFVIENFLGERSSRKAKILEGVVVEVKGDDVTVKGVDRERVGQTVANIERAAAVKYRDIRVFQDGVYRISKGVK
jgi:large subunit ribosomal protein L6